MSNLCIKALVLLVLVFMVFLYMAASPLNVTLTWTAPYDSKPDGSGVRCVEYDLRQSSDSVVLSSDWNACARISIPAPLDSGVAETVIIPNLQDETDYFFAIKSMDSTGNWSNMSNIVHVYHEDAVRPAAVNDLRELTE